MNEELAKEILIEGVDARELYGAQNSYLGLIREYSPNVKLIARGDRIKVMGAQKTVQRNRIRRNLPSSFA